jgi:transposase-like protein
VQIHASARKHGISDADMLHAIRMAIRTYREGSLVVYIGPDQAGIRLLEVGVMDATDDDLPRVIHAMSARSKFL